MSSALAMATATAPASLESIELLDRELELACRRVLKIEPQLTRQLVSFQANKQSAAYRWYKYKEAFSGDLVKFLLAEYDRPAGSVLDPFSGMGTTLFAAREAGLDAIGIELLPLGVEIVKARMLAEDLVSTEDLQRLKHWRDTQPWHGSEEFASLNELRITCGAYPPETETGIRKFLAAARSEPAYVNTLLRFAVLCVLEVVSFTRKDGQYLRWDYRSGRRGETNTFDKGRILPFDAAIVLKLTELLSDLELGRSAVPSVLFNDDAAQEKGKIGILRGSCLDLLSKLESESHAVVLTSPPYCNRYDYTRTYALELALLGVDEEGIKQLRQEMLSCTVENREKDLLAKNPLWRSALAVADAQELLQEILAYLDRMRAKKQLNNPGIARMVRNYFYEMSCVIQECSRILKSGGIMFMVNDNVRYAGASISVDLILSDIASGLGLVTERILVLPNGKGNSSQQMGAHGRDALRKCVYVWRKA